MRHQTEVRCRIGVAEGRKRGGKRHKSGNGFAGLRTQAAFGSKHGAASVSMREFHMYVQTRAGFACRNLRSESDVKTLTLCEIAYHPLGEHKLVGGVAGIYRQELYFVLLVYLAVEGEVAHLRVAVLYLGACAGYIAHTQRAEVVEFGKGRRFVVASLVGGGECAGIRGYHVILQLAHGVEVKPRGFAEGTACLVEHLLGSRFERLAVFVEEGAKHSKRGQRSERIDESRAETRHNIKVGAAGAYKGEQRRTVHTLAESENGFEICLVVDYEIKGLQASVGCRIHEVYHFDAVVGNEIHNVGL